MHRLLFLEPGHFHATLTLRQTHPRVDDEVVVYVSREDDASDFLVLIERFNRRATHPTRWRPLVIVDVDPLARLVSERRGDVVVLAGRNGGKVRTMRQLHESGFHVLADKPWLVEPEDLEDIRASLADWPLTMEIMTGRHDVAARLFKRVVDHSDVFGGWRGAGPAIELESMHHLDKLVDGAPLRRPWWFFDVRVQGGGAVDIPTHVVDQTQWLLETSALSPGEIPRLISARAWPTAIPLDAFRRITGEATFPRELHPLVEGDVMSYCGNAELAYRLGHVTVQARSSWRLSSPDGGGDTHSALAHGMRADVSMERNAHTGYRRKLLVRPRAEAAAVARGIDDVIARVQCELPGVGVARAGDGSYEVTIPPVLDTGHESHFPLVLAEFLATIDDRHWPAALAQRTLAKYTLLAKAAGTVRDAGCP